MDQSTVRVNVEGGSGPCWLRGRRLAVAFAVQNLVLAGCFVFTFHVYCRLLDRESASLDNVHIHFGTIPSIIDNKTLEFDRTASNNMMHLIGEKNETIYVNCTGPYVLYVKTCYKSLNDPQEATGILQLQAMGDKTPICNFTMQASKEVCRGLQNIVYLKSKQQISLRLYSSGPFMMKMVTVGFTYMLGTERHCFDEVR